LRPSRVVSRRRLLAAGVRLVRHAALAHAARVRAGRRAVGLDRAHRTLGDARRAARAVHRRRPGQGAGRACRRLQARAQERDDPDRDRHRHLARDPDFRLGDRRAGLQHSRPRAPDHLGGAAARRPARGATHWSATDDGGRDVWSRVVYGARLSLLVGAAVVLLAFAIGLVCGLAAGYWRRLDNPVMRVMDGLMAFPAIILAIALMASLGPSVLNVIVAIGVVYAPRVARIVRGSVLVIRETTYVEAARALVVSDLVIVARHVLPNCLSPAIVQASFVF